MNTLAAQELTLFDPAPEPARPGALPYLAADTAAYSAALVGDGYAWLGRVLSPPVALPCPRCRRPMALPAVPLLWQCPDCDTNDARREAL